ncbi:MAG: hypothetical protein AAF351_02790 [Pseudomonadota bacterium]
MFRTFLIGVILGIGAGFAGFYFVPLVDQERENSIIKVARNIGNTEQYHANIPMDRIVVGAAGQANPLPAGLEWPLDTSLAGVRTELLKMRNQYGTVIGVASRIAVANEDAQVIEWTLHVPARGSAYITMDPQPTEDGYRVGNLRAGTEEYAPLSGSVTERWIADTSGEEGAPAGRIELIAAFVASGEVGL